ncbi:hypothetical protein [Leptospira jelokensis]|uniref:Uncharacterized protein n=1 Tax=Leptospira jelokensis TaxID=2484931 RepID=A0A4Z1A3S2_9LEPT|nr:hypothetical protein [Leptospira jelokensis]TGL66458.1 hypothetical protein EHQ62_09760 [Leptospira jelokensis]
MLKIVFSIFVFLFFANCTNFFSPFGIRGEEAKKQLQEHRNNLGFVSFLGILSGSISSTSYSSNSNYTCQRESSAITAFSTPTTGANFNLPSATEYVDLTVISGGTQYFRSNQTSASLRFTGKILKTQNTSSNAICYYTASAGACGTTDLSGLGISSTIGSFMTVDSGQCLAIRCTETAYIRLKQYSTETASMATLDSVSGLINGPYIFEAITRIGDRAYYTMESFDRCKKEITNFALIEIQYASFFSSQLVEVGNCNKPNSALQGLSFNPALTSSLQADACDLEPVNAVGF